MVRSVHLFEELLSHMKGWLTREKKLLTNHGTEFTVIHVQASFIRALVQRTAVISMPDPKVCLELLSIVVP